MDGTIFQAFVTQKSFQQVSRFNQILHSTAQILSIAACCLSLIFSLYYRLPGHLVKLHISASSFRPMQPGPFVHDLVRLLVPFPQVVEHLLHVVHVCHSDNNTM